MIILKCPYCSVDYNSVISLNAHVENCFYKYNSVNEQENDNDEIPVYEHMKYAELKSLASAKGINANKMKKENIIKALNELEGWVGARFDERIIGNWP